jgi:methyl-accepting chemotaxis protein
VWHRLPAFRFPIRYKLMLLFLTVSLAPIGVATVLARNNVLHVEHDVVRMARASQEARVANTARMLDEQLQGLVAEMVVAGNLPELHDFLSGSQDATAKERVRAALTALAKKDAYHESVAVAGPDGMLIVSSVPADDGLDITFRPYFQEAIKGSGYLSDVSISTATHRPAFFASAPVRGANGQVIGVVRARLDLAGIVKRIADDVPAFGGGSESMLLDEYGLRIALSDQRANLTPREGGLLLTAIGDVPEDVRRQWVADKRFGVNSSEVNLTVNPNPELAAAIRGGREGTTQIGAEDNKQEVTYASLTVKPWRYVATVPVAVVTATTVSTIAQLTRVGLLTAAAAILAAFLFGLTMTRPLVRLAKVADGVSMGDTDVSVDVGSNDEIGDLAASFARMVASVRFYMRRATHNPPDSPVNIFDRAA